MNFGLKLLAAVRTDLEDVVAITSGGKKITSNNQNKSNLKMSNNLLYFEKVIKKFNCEYPVRNSLVGELTVTGT